MGQVILRFWSQIKPNSHDIKFSHVSLEIYNFYFSFQPELDNEDFLYDQTNRLYQGRIATKAEDYNIGPPDKIFALKLDVNAIAEAINYLTQIPNLSWQHWNCSFDGGFNAFTTVYLLLKKGGLQQKYSKSEFVSKFNIPPAISNVLYDLDTPLNYPAICHFARACQPHLTPESFLMMCQPTKKKIAIANIVVGANVLLTGLLAYSMFKNPSQPLLLGGNVEDVTPCISKYFATLSSAVITCLLLFALIFKENRNEFASITEVKEENSITF